MNTEAKAPIKGCARIIVSDDLVEYSDVKIEKPLAGRVAWDWMEVKELFDLWSTFLLLPDGYTIIGVFFDIAYNCWTLLVEGADLPLPKEGEMLPVLSPMYQRTADGKVSLVRESLKMKGDTTNGSAERETKETQRHDCRRWQAQVPDAR